ncbi:unnamed protein product, partial [Closterium sp. Yama58-4]
PTYRSIYAKDGYVNLGPGIDTMWALFKASVEKFGDNKFLGKRSIVDGKAGPFVWDTYSQVHAKVLKLGSAYRAAGLDANSKVGIYGINSPEWFMAMEACNCQSMQCVPLYDTLGAEAVTFILNHAEVALVVVQAAKLRALLKSLPSCTANVKTVVSMGDLDADSAKALTDMGIRGVTWDDFLKEGEAKPVEPCPSKPEDICTIMYTSGTTGEPKGVLITNHALATAVAGTKRFCEVNDYVLTTTDIYISYLPLAHIFDRVAEELMTHVGGSIGFWQGDVRKLTDDLEALKPTFFCGVPRIFDRIHSAVISKIESTGGLTKMLFDYAYSSKQARLAAGVKIRDATPIFDFLVFNKVKSRLGGNVRIICSGAAPLAPHVEEFLKIAMCCPVVQGYGLTETNTSGFISYADRIEQAGTVGPPMPTLETRLESIPEMNYDAIGSTTKQEGESGSTGGGDSGEAQAHPPRGEVCIRGPILFSGYYKREDLTKEAVDGEGWFHTGDIGEWQADGSMKIIDRKKNIFKLAQGEYVAVENLENVFGNCSAIDMVWVYGNSFEAVLVAVVVPNKPTLLEWAKGAGVEGDYAALCATEEAKKFILGQLTETGKKGKLKGFEMVKAVHLESQPFDMERDLLTPTFKKKRPQLLKYYQAQIHAMYADTRVGDRGGGATRRSDSVASETRSGDGGAADSASRGSTTGTTAAPVAAVQELGARSHDTAVQSGAERCIEAALADDLLNSAGAADSASRGDTAVTAAQGSQAVQSGAGGCIEGVAADSASRGGTAVTVAHGSRDHHTTAVQNGAEGCKGEGEDEGREAESAGGAEQSLPDGEAPSAGVTPGRGAVAEGSGERLGEGLAEDLAERIRALVDVADMGAVREAQGESLGALQDTAAILAHFNAFSLKALASEAPAMRAHTAVLHALQSDLMRSFRKIREMKAKLRKAFPNAFEVSGGF